jgi:CheY-like chemotaxis protein
MRVLFVDPDTTLLALVRRTLEAEGHRVRVASTPEALEVASADEKLDVVVLDAQLAAMTTGACERIRTLDIHVVVSTALSDGDASIRELRDWFGGASYLRKPFAVLDLPYVLHTAVPNAAPPTRRGLQGGELLGRMVARGSAGPQRGWRPPVERANRSLMPRMGGPVVFKVAERLAGAWAERFTGQVRIRGTQTAVGRPLRLLAGGLVDPRDTSIVDIAVRGAELQFVPEPAEGIESGDRKTFIQMLWAAVYRPSEIRFAELHAFEALELGQEGLLIDLIGLVGPDTRAVLEAADGARALGEVVVQSHTTPTAVAADLQALHHLGLIRFTPPATRRVDRKRSKRRKPSDQGAQKGRASTSPKRPESVQSSGPERSFSRSQRRESSSGKRRSGRAQVAEHMRRPDRSGAIHKRLQTEVDRLVDASPAQVLGVPADAPGTLVRDVGGRMHSRYLAIAESEEYPEETRELARALVATVQNAISSWGRRNIRASGDPTTDREAIMLEQGMVLIDTNEFARADRVLTLARELAMTNPKILAGLGWARFNNPKRPEAERQEEGRDYLLLAEQFDKSDVWTEWCLYKVFRQLNDPAAALIRAKLVLKVNANHAQARSAVQELEPDAG